MLASGGSWAVDAPWVQGQGWGRWAAVAGLGAYALATLSVPVMLCTRVGKEDGMMRARFGERWEAYARRTPYRLVPFVY